MSYDERIADRVRTALADRDDVVERKMFGGLAFLVRGNMCCGVLGSDLMVRVGPENYPAALEQPHAREMDFTGRALKGLVYVSKHGIHSDQSLWSWVSRGLEFVASLPRKQSGPGAKSRRRPDPVQLFGDSHRVCLPRLNHERPGTKSELLRRNKWRRAK